MTERETLFPFRYRVVLWVKTRGFEVLQSTDDWLHDRGHTSRFLCRLVGRWEIAYYERGIDWDNPIYVRDTPEKIDG